MELVKKNADYSIFKKRSGRYCIENAKGQRVLAADKVKILADEKLIKIEKAKPKAEPKAEPEAPKA
jgi:hypothetical protein